MSDILDDLKSQQDLDRSHVYDSVISLPQQCRHAYQDTQPITIPASYRKVNKMVMCGMGGSGLGARVIESVYFDSLKLPLIRINNYHLPSWVDSQTLVICSSFSGTTEETVANAKEAISKKAKWLAISAGGDLIDLARLHQVPYYQINPKYNPSQQPRMGIGYSIIGQLMLVNHLGLIKFTSQDLASSVSVMNSVIKGCQVKVPKASNPAKKMAEKIKTKQVVFVAADHLTGAIHVFKNQMNENAKHFSSRHEIPELNHHLMEALKYPSFNSKFLIFFFASSQIYSQKIQKRFMITKEIIAKNNLEMLSYELSGPDKLSQVFELIQFGGFVNFYLSMLHHLDPAPVPWVDYFKTKLGQSLGQWK